MKGTLGGVYDADGDGDFDVEDAKVLLGECDFICVCFSPTCLSEVPTHMKLSSLSVSLFHTHTQTHFQTREEDMV